MFAFLSPYKLIFEALAALALIAAITYGVHCFLEHERDIGYNKAVAEYNAKQIIAEQAAREKETQLNKQLAEAQNAATLRDQQINALNNSLIITSNSLRDVIANKRSGLSSAPIDALRKTADTALSLLGECTKKYGDVAKAADGHASDVKTLQDAWPK